MKASRIISNVCRALSLLNFLVGGLMGFILIREADSHRIFTFLYFVFLAVAVFCLFIDWVMAKNAAARTQYTVRKLRKGRWVREQRSYDEYDELRGLQSAISGWLFSLNVPLIAALFIWWRHFEPGLSELNVMVAVTAVAVALTEFVIEIIIVHRKRKKGEPV